MSEPHTRREATLGYAETSAAIDSSRAVEPNADVIPPVLPTRRYDRRETIGRGGMGEVLLCRDGTVGRDVAMKVIRTEFGGANGEMASRFLREARVQGQLEHPAIVPVYDLGVDDRGELFFTMKRVKGRSLETVVDKLRAGDEATQKQYSRRRLLNAFVNVCMAVDFAHRRGVLHRDLKPGNVMLGDFGEVYVLDWGIAKVLSDADEGVAASTSGIDLEATAEGRLVGSPGYMSPEQCRGEGTKLTAATDVYSLGAILFEILTHERLHRGASPFALIAATIAGGMEPPSKRAPDLGIPPELDALCVRALSMRPGDRFESARSFSDAIEAFLDGDRDVEARRTASAAHVENARAAILRSRRPTADEAAERSRAMRELTSAFGLDPNNHDAMDTMVQLLMSPPRVLPEEALEGVRASSIRLQQTSNRWGAAAFLGFTAALPAIFMMGIRVWWLLALQAVAIFTSAIGCWWVATKPRKIPRAPMVVLVASNIALFVLSFTLGPLIMAPVVCLANLLGLLLTSDRTRRVLIVAAGVASILVPLVLQLVGVLPAAYTFENDTLVVHSFMYHLPKWPTLFFMSSLPVTMLIVAGFVGAAFRDLLLESETKVRLMLWQLRQMMPEQARHRADQV